MSYVQTGMGSKLVLESNGFASSGSQATQSAVTAIQTAQTDQPTELDTAAVAAMTVGGALLVGGIVVGAVYLLSQRSA